MKLVLLSERGVRLNFEPYFIHFPTPPPPLQVVIAQSLTYNKVSSGLYLVFTRTEYYCGITIDAQARFKL